MFCCPDALGQYWCVKNYEVRKVSVSFKENYFCRKGIFQELLNKSVGQGGGAEQESGEGAVSCASTDVLCDPQLSAPTIMQEMITSR